MAKWLALPGLLLFFAIVVSAQEPELQTEATTLDPAGPVRINKIHVETYDAFDPRIPQYRSWVFRFLNKVHNKTSDSFIKRELLLREGDPLDPELLTETERNLRKYKFLDNVRIEAKPVGYNLADLHVHTEDQWTTQVEVSAGKSSGFSKFNVGLEESNFLGLGKTVGVGFRRDPERTTYDFLYYDPQFFNSHWKFETGYEEASDGWRMTTDLIKPFYSLDTKWAYGVSLDSGTLTDPKYLDGRVVAEIDTTHRSGIFFAARAWGDRYNKKRFGLLLSMDKVFYPNPARILFPSAANVKQIQRILHPLDRESYQYGALFKLDKQQYIEETYLDNFGRIEDLPVGLQWTTIFARAEDVSLVPDYFQLHTIAQYNRQLNSFQYLALQGNFSIRHDALGNFSNLILGGYAHYYMQLPEIRIGKISFPRQTLAANLTTTLTQNVDAPFQISLGEDEGLRGYKFKTFTGQNKLLLNLEDRIFTNWNNRLFGVGFVGFLDAGYVWADDEHLRLKDFGLSAGFGLRIGLKKAQSARILRIDFAVPLHKGTSSFTQTPQKGYSISISSGQIFPVLEKLPKLFDLF